MRAGGQRGGQGITNTTIQLLEAALLNIVSVYAQSGKLNIDKCHKLDSKSWIKILHTGDYATY